MTPYPPVPGSPGYFTQASERRMIWQLWRIDPTNPHRREKVGRQHGYVSIRAARSEARRLARTDKTLTQELSA